VHLETLAGDNDALAIEELRASRWALTHHPRPVSTLRCAASVSSGRRTRSCTSCSAGRQHPSKPTRA
jgi:hypothetical protein